MVDKDKIIVASEEAIELSEAEFNAAIIAANSESAKADSAPEASAFSPSESESVLAELNREYNRQLRLEPNESLLMFPPSLGKGYIRGIRLREGLDLGVQDYTLNQDLFVNGQSQSLAASCGSLTFCLSGQFSSTFPGAQSTITMQAGEASFYTTPYAAGTLRLSAAERIHFVDITLAPALILSLIGEDLAKLPQSLQTAIQSGAAEFLVHLCNTSTEISQVLQKIIRCPYHGKIRSVYLESQALELFALYFSQFFQSSPSLLTDTLKPQDFDRLYQGREILKQNLMTPPSLAELSEQVGLSERKLQQGFRELFGTTVFGVLHRDRLERARQLLETQQMTIGAIADTVGISHRGYFAKAFKRKFGSTPREYLKRFS
ncbi:MAG: AraC family transcriptional regulator [Cyanobacteria bacterium J06621_8]